MSSGMPLWQHYQKKLATWSGYIRSESAKLATSPRINGYKTMSNGTSKIGMMVRKIWQNDQLKLAKK
jgi:hypothetical protein